MPELSAYELEREANIARNRALLQELDLKDAVTQLGIPPKPKPAPRTRAKPIQPAKKVKREREVVEAPRRQSARLKKEVVDPNETAAQKKQREAEQKTRRRIEEQERIEAEEKARLAKRPRHQELDLTTLGDKLEDSEVSSLRSSLQAVTNLPLPKRTAAADAFVFHEDRKNEAEVKELRKRLQKLRIVSRAKVTEDRVYSAAYHPEATKDLVFFGDKHGQIGIWDARAPADEVEDEDGDISADHNEGGKYWRLQCHWPASSKSSISSIKFDPVDAHSLFTTSYDGTIRRLSFVSGISQEIFSSDEHLITSIDLPVGGNEMWISDASGGLTHLDLREPKDKACWYGLSGAKIGTVSINPTSPHFLLTASNSRLLKVWDSRKLQKITSATGPYQFSQEAVENLVESKKGEGTVRGEFAHGKSVSSAYWDPRGRGIVSTSYDDTIRLWDLDATKYSSSTNFPSFTPFSRIRHNCQTGKWVTILRAIWNPNPDVFPHFTIGNLNHSLDIYSCKGDLIARLSDSWITATQAVTCSHPSVVERCATGNASGRCVLWAPPDV
ncbi:WD40-repeat-containing domain protein [Suillus clintonianus]|uniref:WD40-repeat-containing domain protein n=1 Tax=Suillus clintonianus TaxID=1904413 RepID=UPI001B87630A|nr:WD40-repeat-containing domain protein [Suillus clintonianus]KAG2157168.1 WD40-repeat-containing domain protein [Suillus clintonianus]